MRRVQADHIIQDLNKKMVLLTGPRQVGKTFLAKQIAQEYAHPVYLNYDHIEDKKIIDDQAWFTTTDLLILDELHKMPYWKNYLKGIYDTKSDKMKILVTGSARLDIDRQVGDSLAGRYFLHHLLPLSPAEMKALQQPFTLEDFIVKSGFPEPLLSNVPQQVNRWRMQYIESLINIDILDFQIQNIKALKTTFELLRTKVGSPISYQSLAQDIGISPITIKKYIQVLEALYLIFLVTPFSKKIARSLLKEPKVYFFDSGLVKGDEGAQLENLVAICLLKEVYAKIDYQGEKYALHYLRTKDKQEVDFALVKNDAIEKIIEVKSTAKEISRSLYFFHHKYHFSALQIVNHLYQERMQGEIMVRKAEHFLNELS